MTMWDKYYVPSCPAITDYFFIHEESKSKNYPSILVNQTHHL